VLAGFVLLLLWGPSIATTNGLVVNVIAQKIVAVVVIALVTFLCLRTLTSRRERAQPSN
jgi:hypothetical protein